MIRSVKGTRDLLPAEMPKWHAVEEAARQVFSLYGFEEIRTPVFEETELFVRSIGSATDIVEKEMYTFRDRSDNSLTLRPEMTASVVRAYLENHLGQGQATTRLYYIGPMFRYERPQKGRYRQFYQIGAEVLGSDHPGVEAEVLEMLILLLERLGITGTELLVNSIGCGQCRPAYVEKLRSAVESRRNRLCADCVRRSEANVLRVLDCKVESCQPVIAELPWMVDHLCAPCADHFARFRGYLEAGGLSYRVEPRLVRGLDYYVRTTFEITSPALGAQNALLGGGRYDGLAELLGGPPVHGIGFALGLDRFVLALPEEASAAHQNQPHVAVIPIGDAQQPVAMRLARRLRAMGVRCYTDFQSRSLKAQLRQADRIQAEAALIIGENEVRDGRFLLKNLRDSSQKPITEDDLIALFQPAATAVSN